MWQHLMVNLNKNAFIFLYFSDRNRKLWNKNYFWKISLWKRSKFIIWWNHVCSKSVRGQVQKHIFSLLIVRQIIGVTSSYKCYFQSRGWEFLICFRVGILENSRKRTVGPPLIVTGGGRGKGLLFLIVYT